MKTYTQVKMFETTDQDLDNDPEYRLDTMINKFLQDEVNIIKVNDIKLSTHIITDEDGKFERQLYTALVIYELMDEVATFQEERNDAR